MSPINQLPTEAEVEQGIDDDMREMGLSVAPGASRATKSRVALAKFLLSMRFCRERMLTSEVGG